MAESARSTCPVEDSSSNNGYRPKRTFKYGVQREVPRVTYRIIGPQTDFIEYYRWILTGPALSLSLHQLRNGL